ncbi:DUF2787 family protein [Vibrio parahaemolyticus]|uniref:DUF2787 family protein n=1 Tax=Vibrio harveyi group TaxID=717610 RepID=UPI000C86AD70|nr:DUF2787 family protein [Vibrio parahaemolyticus]QLK44824.1 DUF2787 domain-containing protein [Vibrio owensii]AYO02901.1 DUF2787 domain-containing protein [Vibrio parahaemolyticus]EGQ7810723.1 DUF2787 domain-containing protein [Vibrio parahaemolyticus]EHK0753038.1 DUF2787 domain-containing protein [Vibrio parahaemolyticus]EHR5320095.1 DUF2787 domain-containing protein [Vibrio parahaemolyticus]
MPTLNLVSTSFLQLLSQYCQASLGSKTTSPRLTLRFRDKRYGAKSGGCHPVDIGLTITDKANMTIVYITDFAYAGKHYPALKRHIDFDFRHQLYFTVETDWQRIQSSKVEDLYREWERRFIDHVREGRYDDINVIV